MSKEKKSSRFTSVLLTALIGLGVGGGGVWFYQNNIANAAQSPLLAQEKVEPVIEPIFVDIEPITLTFREERATRILYLGLTIQLQDQLSRERLQSYLPVARSRIITELGDIDPQLLTQRETKDSIRAMVATALEAPFTNEVQRQNITDVLFSAYVVQ